MLTPRSVLDVKEISMGVGRAVTRLAAIGAAIAGAVFFWRKSHPQTDSAPTTEPKFPPAADGK
jgi:hypothetical protein